ncbi:ankyrin repeat domain-containing protein [Aequorivita sp. F47161]|uniref:Ankyrin repeat domain-containing protein n=1 Tax=Aequorivita vitellina TaxID=2874475 RepID=A0A9X1TZ86_9FLAO|nr:ankyrin repeat domain-containing protein [Aequorivita vitellina]MCG2417814.1 ankyrin repeat domain-containing protein [Aequorivita vitellina]
MKTLKFTSFKMTIPMLLLAIFLTSACAQSNKKATARNTNEAVKTIEKPSVDIQTAIISGNIEAVRQHIEAGTDIDQKEAMSGATPLMTAITFNKPEIAKLLLAAGADLSIKNNDGSTALHNAAFFGRIEMVQMLIDAKADKTIRNNYGATPRETVMGDFAEIKPFYEMIMQQLKPMGFQLNLEELQKARPVIAIMLQ